MDIKALIQTAGITPLSKADIDRALLGLLKASLSPGEILEVKTAMSPKGELGILLNGNFLSADLPKNLQANQALLVQVQDIKDSLILKLLSVDTAPSNPELTTAFKKIIETAFPNISFEEIKKAVEETRSELPPKIVPEQARAGAPAPTEGQIILKRAETERLVITPQILSSPRRVADALARILGGDTEKLIRSIIRDVERGAPGNIFSKPHLEVVRTIDRHLNFVLGLKDPLSFDPNVDEPKHQLPERLRLYLAISELAVSSGSQGTLEEIAKHLSTIKRDTNPLVVLFKALTTLNMIDLPTKNTETKKVARFLTQFIEDLTQLKEQKLPDKDIRRVLKDKQSVLNQVFGEALKRIDDAGSKSSALSLLRSLENLAAAQDNLNQCNRLMSDLGEPALFFLPIIFDGLFVKSEFRISRAPVEIDAEGKNGGKNAKKSFTNLSLKISLPRLGEASVNAAYRANEIYLSLVFEKPESADFVSKRLPLLERSLEQLGFTNRSLRAEVGTPTAGGGSWFEALAERKIIA